MKRNKVNIKRMIKSRNKYTASRKAYNYNVKKREKTQNNNIVKNIVKSSIIRKEKQSLNIKNKTYKKRIDVDYDIAICIPSYNRYEKICRLLNQFYNQDTKYTFIVVLLNDGSDDKRYDELEKRFNRFIYIKNDKPNGKLNHWYCYNQMWNEIRKYNLHAVLQMDDDFILCNNFLNKIVDEFFKQKNIDGNIMGISPHTYSFNKYSKNESFWYNKTFVDGISLLDVDVLKYMNYQMIFPGINAGKRGTTAGTWHQINDTVKKMGGYYYRTEKSLVFHDGNNDSKLHGGLRKIKKIYTQKMCDSLKNIIKNE